MHSLVYISLLFSSAILLHFVLYFFVCLFICAKFFNFYLLTLVKMFQIELVDHMIFMVFHHSCLMQ